ncbi:MAG: hypothetical protein QOF25_4127 [Mycobacterium sp.]|nr:hypothetical protein [Mycobacterium sp.]
MNDTLHQPRWRRVVDGGHTWGSLTISPNRYGVTRHHLVVFPPGISPDDRVLLRVWRTWPIWGALTWLVMEMFLVPTIGSGPALAISTGVCLCAGALLMAMAGANRTRVRTLAVVRMAGVVDAVAVDRYAELYALAHELADADRTLAAGELSTVDHEAVVWRVYDRLSTAVRS